MGSEWVFLLLLSLTNVVGMVGYAVTGFGENIVFQLCWYAMSCAGLASGNLIEAVTILTIIQIPLLCAQAFLQWHRVNVLLAITISAAQSSGTMWGVDILVHYDGIWLQRCLGIVLVAVFMWRALAESIVARPETPSGAYQVCTLKGFIPVVITGVTGGILGGLFSVPGPPNMIFVLLAGISKDEWRATNALSGVIMLTFRLIDLVVEVQHSDYERLLPEVGVSFVGGFAGLLVGNALAPWVSEKLFRETILVLLLAGGTSLSTAGLSTSASAWVYLAAFILGVAYFLAERYRARKTCELSVGFLDKACAKDGK